MEEFILDKLRVLPDASGVYLMKDAEGVVIYVGKAVNLKRRVKSYFYSSGGHSLKTKALVSKIRDFELITTSSELEALILECALIKKYRPEYNILLKDGGGYPYIELFSEYPFPSIRTSRNRTDKRNKLFGPYVNAENLRRLILSVRRFFKIRICKDREPKRKRPCLYHQIGLCSGPCAGLISLEDYSSNVRNAVDFLNGKIDGVIDDLYKRINEESEKFNFEKCAAILKDIKAIEKLKEKQKVVFEKEINRDYVGFFVSGCEVLFKVLIVRNGVLIDKGDMLFASKFEESDAERLKIFILNYYEYASFIPPEIYVPCMPEDSELLERWMSEKAGRKVELSGKPRGRNREIIEMALHNAEVALESVRASEKRNDKMPVLEEIQAYLSLPSIPLRIETYDISNLSGKNAVGSMVVLTRGVPDKKNYRKFKIRFKETPDDFAMMREVLSRRFTIDRNKKADIWKTNFPDLIVIDGGKGQLGAVADIIAKQGVPFVGLAKKNEEIYFPDAAEPLVLSKDSRALNLIRLSRDEAHRFAVSFHRKLRRNEAFKRKDRNSEL